MPVAAPFPAPFASFHIEAAEDTVGEAVSRAAMDHIVVERRLDRARLPLSLGDPPVARVRNLHQLHAILGLRQEMPLADWLRLRNRQQHSFARPLPRQLAG